MLNNKARYAAEDYFIEKGLMPRREDRTEQWCLHHIDPNQKENDFETYRLWRPEDLVPMTMAEHTILHNQLNTKNRYEKVSKTLKERYKNDADLKKRISDGMKAYIKRNGGHHCERFGPHKESPETIAKMSAARKGKKLYNNGEKNKFFDTNNVPDGWVEGKVSKNKQVLI